MLFDMEYFDKILGKTGEVITMEKKDLDAKKGFVFGDEDLLWIKNKYADTNCTTIRELCSWEGGIKTNANEAYFTSELMYNKHRESGLVRKVQTPEDATKGVFRYMIWIPYGISELLNIPEDIMSHLESFKDKLSNRASLGSKWYELDKHGSRQVTGTHGICVATMGIKVYKLENNALSINPNLLVSTIKTQNEWIINYLNSKICGRLYDILSGASAGHGGMMYKSVGKLSDMRVPVSLTGQQNITDKDIQEAFGFTDEEVAWLLTK